MSLTKLTEKQMSYFADRPETAMGVHMLKRENKALVFVLGGQVVLESEPEAMNALSEWVASERKRHFESDRPNEGVSDEQDNEQDIERFNKWRSGLEETPDQVMDWSLMPRPLIAFSMAPPGAVPPPPPAPTHIYGHLPFTGTTDPGDVFYRCEPWPTSRRIVLSTNLIAADTYAAPESELPFFPTGFAAVGRYALPNLLPACYRWKLDPPKGTPLDCGASVPLYGQAGGGVEVRFRSNTTNSNQIARPVRLPPL